MLYIRCDFRRIITIKLADSDFVGITISVNRKWNSKFLFVGANAHIQGGHNLSWNLAMEMSNCSSFNEVWVEFLFKIMSCVGHTLHLDGMRMHKNN